jgi:hypothetical protein
MNNLSFSENKKKKSTSKEEPKKLKNIEYSKEILDLEKILAKVEEKYELKADNHVSGALVYIKYSIESLKKSIIK